MPASAIAPRPPVVVFHCASAPRPEAILPHLGQSFAQAEIVQLDGDDLARLLSPQGTAPVNWLGTIDWLRQHRFAAALILTEPGQSPYTLGYLCYLAGIPMRVGRSQEFGGQVLTHCLEEEGLGIRC